MFGRPHLDWLNWSALGLLLIPMSQRSAPAQEPAAADSVYPVTHGPIGYGIFEEMHWPQLRNKPAAYSRNPYLAGAVFHLPWAALEPSKGQLDTQLLDQLLDRWGKAGKRIVLDIKVSPSGLNEHNPYQESATPPWVYDLGVPYFEAKKNGAHQRLPLTWDPTFVKEYERFVRLMADKYDGHPTIEFLIVAPGVYGTTRAIYPELIAGFKQAGYSDAKWFAAVDKVLDIYQAAFKKTPLTMAVAPFVKDHGVEDPRYNNLTLAKQAAEKGFALYYHNLRGTPVWRQSPYPPLFSSLGKNTKIALGLDNPTSLNEQLRKKYGAPMTFMQYALGGIAGLPSINTHYLVLYSQDVEAATVGEKRYQKEYEDAMKWAAAELKKR